MALRVQPPAYSPLPAAVVLEALAGSRAGASDPVRVLAASLRRDYAAEAVALPASGTQALQLALERASRHGTNAVAALPAYTCPEVAAAAIAAGLRIALYDIEPGTLGPDVASLERLLRAGARIVVAAPLFGMPVDWEEMARLTASHGAVLIEDAAQGQGATWRDRPLGTLGSTSVLSFGRGKGWTGGAGGALLLRDRQGNGGTPDPFASSPLAGLPACGPGSDAIVAVRAALQSLLGRPSLYGLPKALPFLALGETRYHPSGPPGAIPRSAAAILVATREAAAAEAVVRRANAAQLLGRIGNVSRIRRVRVLPEAGPGYLRLPLLLSRGMGSFRDPAAALRLGVAGGYPRTLAAWPQVRRHLVDADAPTPGAEQLTATLITLPTHSRVTPAERECLLDLLESLS